MGNWIVQLALERILEEYRNNDLHIMDTQSIGFRNLRRRSNMNRCDTSIFGRVRRSGGMIWSMGTFGYCGSTNHKGLA
jgi:hypothetical protein